MNRRKFLRTTAAASAANMILGSIPLFAETPPQPLPKNGMLQAGSPVTPVLTRSYNNARTCTNNQEAILNVANLTQRGIKRATSLMTPGDKCGCEAQPLIVPNVQTADGRTHDLVILATMSNNIYAYDFNTYALVWSVSLGTPITGSTGIDGWLINDHWGILSTPVADQDSKILYCVCWMSATGQTRQAAHFVHAINLTNGSDVHPPINLAGTTYNPGHGLPPQKFVSLMRKQRSALLLTNVNGLKTVFFGCGTVSETNNQARGWIIAIDVKSFAVAASFTTSARYSGGGIWQAGQGLAADSKGFIYCMTGNGSFDAKTEWGECFLKLKYTPAQGAAPAALAVSDWWSPFSDAGRAGQDPTLPNTTEGGDDANPTTNYGEFTDQDLGSGGPMCIEDFGILAGAGKDGILYVTDMNNMGKTSNQDFANPAGNYAKLKAPPIWFTFYPGNGVPSAPQRFTDIDKYYFNLTHHQHSTPVVYDSPTNGRMLFTWGENGNLRAWSINANGLCTYLACSAEIASPNSQNNNHNGGMPGGMLSLSCNGKTAGSALLWALVPTGDANREHTPGVLYCYDADNFGTFADGSKQLRVLWNSSNWGLNFTHPKFNVPVVSGGKVFVPTYDGRVDVYNLT